MSFFDREIPSEQTKLVISRYWNNIPIQITVNEKKIELYTSLEDFINALFQEMNNKRFVITSSEKLKQQIFNAANSAVEKIKESTSQII